MLKLSIDKLREKVKGHDGLQTVGKLRRANGILLSCSLPAAIGDQCQILTPSGRPIRAEVIGFTDGIAQLVCYEHPAQLWPGLNVVRTHHGLTVPMGHGLLTRVINGLGNPIDDRGPLTGCSLERVAHQSPPPLERARITRPFVTGLRAIDSLIPLGLGQRVGIFAGSGVGKSTLLGEIAKNANADINVIALIGERGREVRPFLDDCVGPRGMDKSVVVVATCDETPLMRVRAAEVAVSIADHFRQSGLNVLLMVDSLTRLAMAQRELGLALGEPPSARGYTPSVFQLLAQTVERLGNAARGSITGLLTVLVDGDDLDEPISDAVRSFVDGHIVLDRQLAELGHYPAISISRSVSRVAQDMCDPGHLSAARKIREILATYAEAEDLIRIGAYIKGSSPQVDKAIELRPAVLGFLRQQINEFTNFSETRSTMDRIAAAWPF